EVIAVGIFLTPAGMAKSLGSPMWLLIVWLLMGAMALCGALCYGELGARFPEAGGGYVYLREAYGRLPAFLYGWMAFLVLDPGLTAALAVGMASYASYVLNLDPLGMKAVAIGAILVLAAINIRGVRIGAGVMKGLTLIKIGLLAFIALWGFGRGLGDWSHFKPFVAQHPGSEPFMEALAGALVLGFFSFGGWWDLSKVAGELRDPERTLPRALTLGIFAVTFIYILTSAAFLYLVPLERVTSGETFAAQVGEVLFGRAGGQAFASIVVISVLGSLAAFIMAAPRVYYAMARDGLFFEATAQIHPRFGTPARAIALQAALASLLVVIGTFDEIVAYFFFAVVVFIALTVAAVYVLRRQQMAAIVYRTPGYPLTPLVFLVLVSVLLVLLAVNNPQQSLLGVGVVALGVPVYQLIFRHKLA
ncbi:MAG TPA: amino acid permease, partial [Pyrinomonadaceae bacterium]|nr:amino acid permease [Pyrinomonadaceae bacterium]